MRLQSRLRSVTSIVTLAALLLATATTPARAVYNPRTGRWLQRDPNGTGVVLQSNLAYHAANPTVTVSMAYQLQFGDGMNLYEYVRSNPVNHRDPSGLSLFGDLFTSSAIRLEIAAMGFAAAHPLAMRFTGGLLAAANLYAFAQYEEMQAIVVAQPNPLGFLTGEAVALRLAVRDLTSTLGSATALTRAGAGTQELVAASNAYVRRATQSFKPFTQGNFRENLSILTGELPPDLDAHHVFPVFHIKNFQAAGIDIHDPIYGAWWQWRIHRGGGNAYNKVWEDFFTTTPNREQILQKGRELAQKLGFNVHY